MLPDNLRQRLLADKAGAQNWIGRNQLLPGADESAQM